MSVLAPPHSPSLRGEAADAIAATFRSNHLELNCPPMPATLGPLAAQARAVLVQSNAPLPGEGAAAMEISADAAAAAALGEGAAAMEINADVAAAAAALGEDDESLADQQRNKRQRTSADGDMLTSNHKHECADIILKVMLLSSHFPLYTCDDPYEYGQILDGREACDLMNSLVATHMAFNHESDITEESAKVFRKALYISRCVLKDAVSSPVTFAEDGQIGEGDVYRLNICVADLLRTLNTMGEYGFDPVTDREYSRACRSADSQGASTMCNFMRSKDPAEREAYASADQMYNNFDKGVAKMERLCGMRHSELIAFLDAGKGPVGMFLTGFLMASVFDGNRMRCANAVAARYYGNSPDAYGKSIFVHKLFGSSSDLISISRVVYTVCALLSMAKCNLFAAANEAVVARLARQTASSRASAAGPLSADAQQRVKDHHLMLVQKEAQSMPVWGAVLEIANKLRDAVNGRLADRSDSPGANADAMAEIANWFEDSTRDGVKFSVLLSALAYDGFCIDKTDTDKTVRRSWREFRESNCQMRKTNVSLWFACQFLVSSRLQRHNVGVSGSNIMTAALVVLTGAIGHLAGVDERGKTPVGGPFKFSPHVEKNAQTMYGAFRMQKIKVVYDADAQEAEDLGKTCGMTEISRRIYQTGRVRKQHEKSRLIDTRLKASLFWLSFKEALDFDISCTDDLLPATKRGVTAAPSEGRKGLRRLYIVALQTLPCLKFASCHNKEVPHLIEQSRRSPSNNKTTGDNVEKPWRDINGGALISTIFYPMAGRAFVDAIGGLIDTHGPTDTDLGLEADAVDDELAAEDMEERRNLFEHNFKCKTGEAVKMFAKCFETQVRVFFPRRKVAKPTSGLMKEDYGRAAVVLGQQVSLAMCFSKCIRQCAPLWEDMNLIFSVQKAPTVGVGQAASEDDEDVDFEPPPPPAGGQGDDEEWDAPIGASGC